MSNSPTTLSLSNRISDVNQYRRGFETCPQAKTSKSGISFFFFRRVRATSMTQRRVENTRVHLWTFSPVSVKANNIILPNYRTWWSFSKTPVLILMNAKQVKISAQNLPSEGFDLKKNWNKRSSVEFDLLFPLISQKTVFTH